MFTAQRPQKKKKKQKLTQEREKQQVIRVTPERGKGGNNPQAWVGGKGTQVPKKSAARGGRRSEPKKNQKNKKKRKSGGRWRVGGGKGKRTAETCLPFEKDSF